MQDSMPASENARRLIPSVGKYDRAGRLRAVAYDRAPVVNEQRDLSNAPSLGLSTDLLRTYPISERRRRVSRSSRSRTDDRCQILA